MRLASLLLLFVLVSLTASAQTAPRRVVLVDGSVIVGVIADESSDPVVVVGDNGIEQRIPRAQIARIEALAGGRFRRVDPTRTRLVFSPTGRTLGRAGQTRLGLLSVIIPNVTYAVSPRIDVGSAGFYLIGEGSGLVVPGAKVQVVDGDGLDVALGASAVIPFSSDDTFDGAFGLTPYVAATLGSSTQSFTVGATALVGGSFSTLDFEAADGVILSVGGEAQTSNSVKLLAEVLVPIGEGTSGVAFLPGVRFFGDRFSADVFGVVGTSEGDFGGFAPLGSFTYNF